MVKKGDYIIIKENVIDTKVRQLYEQGKSKAARRWEGYINAALEVIAVDDNQMVTVQDSQGHSFTISKRGYDIVQV